MIIKTVSECELSYEEKIKLLSQKLEDAVKAYERLKFVDGNYLKRIEDIKLGLEFQTKYESFVRRKNNG